MTKHLQRTTGKTFSLYVGNVSNPFLPTLLALCQGEQAPLFKAAACYSRTSVGVEQRIKLSHWLCLVKRHWQQAQQQLMAQNRAGLTSEASDILPPTSTYTPSGMLPQWWFTTRKESKREVHKSVEGEKQTQRWYTKAKFSKSARRVKKRAGEKERNRKQER